MCIPTELLQPANSDDYCFETASSAGRTNIDDSGIKLQHLQAAVNGMTAL
jgi:hypothetical protein